MIDPLKIIEKMCKRGYQCELKINVGKADWQTWCSFAKKGEPFMRGVWADTVAEAVSKAFEKEYERGSKSPGSP